MAPTAVYTEDTEATSTGKGSKTVSAAVRAISHGPPLAGFPTFTSAADKRQWQLTHMAAAFRFFARSGYTEGASGHITIRSEEHPNAMWMNPLNVHFGLLKASDMVLVDMESGEIIGGSRRTVNRAGFFIHRAVHKARPDVHAVCHAHGIHGRAYSCFARPLEMLTQDVCNFHNAHSVYSNYGGIVFSEDEGVNIAKALGQGKGCILMNHGLLTVGGTVDEAAFMFGLMERSCQIQLLADAAENDGRRKVIISDEEAAWNFQQASDPEALHCEFQPDFDYENHMSKGEIAQ